MLPYSGLFFFYILLLALIPAVVLGVLEKRIKFYGLIVNLIILSVIFYNSKQQLIYLAFFIIWGFALVKSTLVIKQRPRYGFFIVYSLIANLFILTFVYFSKPTQKYGYLIAFLTLELILAVCFKLFRYKHKRGFLNWALIILSLMPLIYTKFGSMLLHQSGIGFLGISYLTFKVVQIIIEIQDGLIKKASVLDYLYFILYFPTISSGPIDRFRRFIKDAETPLSRKAYLELLGEGLWKVFVGAGYKFILAYFITNYWMNKVPPEHNLLNTLNYMYAYSFYLFFDFAGYSLIAIGISYILGIKTPENFNKPFISKDIKDFWNRWHMTLSFWFRDFIYTRIIMAALKNKGLRKYKYASSYVGYLITMGLMGIWHGTDIYYILYGLYHGLLIVATDLFQRKVGWYKKVKDNILWKCLSIFVTFNLICFGFLIFSGYLFVKAKK